MAKLSKTFRIENADRSKDSELEIEVEYDPSEKSISDVEVNAFDHATRNKVPLTPIFDFFPELQNIVDGIDWIQEYSEYQTDKKEVYND